MNAADDQQAHPTLQARIGRCPHCGSRTRLDETNPWRPFCSERCKLVDLEGWFEGRYRITDDSDADPTFLEPPADCDS
ncbi:MAG TPA: DNA gyrase inhibitor YacG [Nevskiaceae bacterium]|nr:DNA gyrase inhibitor YacG [Nevskiaceae bacterium]